MKPLFGCVSDVGFEVSEVLLIEIMEWMAQPEVCLPCTSPEVCWEPICFVDASLQGRISAFGNPSAMAAMSLSVESRSIIEMAESALG